MPTNRLQLKVLKHVFCIGPSVVEGACLFQPLLKIHMLRPFSEYGTSGIANNIVERLHITLSHYKDTNRD